MGCRTPSVERVADKTVKAKEQLAKLDKMIKEQAESNKAIFYTKIAEQLKNAKLEDATDMGYNEYNKIEYTSEFSLDKIATVVTTALKAAQIATDPTNPEGFASSAAVDAYSDVVNGIAEAAKSSSSSAASLSFAMNRLGPGILAFLYASSINIQDDETFGSEAVTSTSIYYRLMRSERDVELSAGLTATIIRVQADLATFKKMVALQAALVDGLASGKLSIEAYSKLDDQYAAKAAQLKQRVKDGTPAGGTSRGISSDELHSLNFTASPDTKNLVIASVEQLAGMGEVYQAVVEKAQSRIQSGYF